MPHANLTHRRPVLSLTLHVIQFAAKAAPLADLASGITLVGGIQTANELPPTRRGAQGSCSNCALR
jgi:hypothetical protein